MLGEYLWAGSTTTMGLYHLNGNANDSSGNGNNGTATNITWVEGKFWQCASFNGSSSNFRNNNITLSTWTSPYTMSCRIKLNAEISSWAWGLLNLNPDATKEDTIYSMMYQYNWGTRRLHYSHYYNWPETYYELYYNKTLWTAERYNIVCVYSGSNMKAYLNWVEIMNWGWGGTYGFDVSPTYQKWFTVGGDYYLSAFHHAANATFDEVILENTARTAQQIQKYYTYTKWRFWIL